jgi:SAM-dependent methyltransferase
MNSNDSQEYRGWEYARCGDYHRKLDPDWSFTPTYLRKMYFVRRWLNALPPNTRILDAGCGEGLLVEEYSARGVAIEGLDLNYEGVFVRRGDILSMPYEDERFDVVLLLDVFEHIEFVDQPRALQEVRRVLKPKGSLFMSVPNLAHLNSRWRLLFRGALDRADTEVNHPGERPMGENIALLKNNGFHLVRATGITLTVPFLYRRLICRQPARLRWLHDRLDQFACPALSLLNLFVCERDE